jgi:undecaprenyl-phosphate galactose phosphotransferase/putative colanic acid biosynthesis UDP-glucose lipid carrier transferase
MIEKAVLCSDLILILVTSLLTGVAYHILFLNSLGPVETFLSVGGVICVNFSAILAARGDYRPQNLVDFWKQAREITGVWLFIFLVLSAVGFSFKISDSYSRGATLTSFAVGWLAIIVWRFVIARFIMRSLAQGTFAEQKVILVAEKGQLAEPSNVEELRRCGYKPVRTFEFESASVRSLGISDWLLASIKEIVDVTRQEKIGCVFLLVSWDDRRSIERLTELLRALSIPVYLLPDRNVAHFLGGRIVNIGTAWTAELKRAPLTPTEQACKRTLDLLIASAVLITLTPMMILVAALIKLESRGPILFMQTRNGFNGRSFKMCKFRTMSVLEDGPVIRQATKGDPRVTRFGGLLRRTSIDELPQLLNVIAGDMSLVGPRPHASAHNTEYEKIIANYAYRYHVKPGLTGWAQVNGLRGETQVIDLMKQRVEFDLWYINNWSLWLDFRILLRTLLLGLQPTAY